MELSTISNHDCHKPGESLEEKLAYLCKFGRIRLHQYSDGTWGCKVDVFVQGSGVSFEISSYSNHKFPGEAADLCCRRLDKAIADIKNT